MRGDVWMLEVNMGCIGDSGGAGVCGVNGVTDNDVWVGS